MNQKDLYFMADLYFKHQRLLNYSPSTLEAKQALVDQFIRWAKERGLDRIDEMTREIGEDYQKYLYYYRKKDGEPLNFRTQRERLQGIKSFFHWLAKKHYLPFNPVGEIELPLIEKRIPRGVLTIEEMEKVLRQPKLDKPLGIRDRTILETFYSTGIRRMEMIKLSKYDLDPERATLMIRQGKGKKDRLIPIGQRALKWMVKYIEEVRPSLVPEVDGGILFLTSRGNPIGKNRLSQIVRDYIKKADIHKTGSCHMLRHTMATVMLEAGTNLRFIQEMLGHSSITSTQIYTKVSIKKLQEIHTLMHPAKMRKKK